MKILIDAMGAPSNSGGMNLYARQLISAWAEAFDDEIIVIGGAWLAEFARHSRITVRQVRAEGAFVRFWTQSVSSGRVARQMGCDVLLSLSPLVAFTMPRSRRIAIVHDWRHKTRPSEFGLAQRMYRSLWCLSLRRAGLTIAISQKTAVETELLARPRALAIVENGGDHPKDWTTQLPHNAATIQLMTYGHFVNKRPDTVIEAVSLARKRGMNAELVVLGATGTYRRMLERVAQRAGITDHVRLPGYVDDVEYQRLLQRSDVIVLNSSDEGFGLPVLEAAYFGIPVIAATDSGLVELHGDLVLPSAPTPDALVIAIESAVARGRLSAQTVRTWAECAAEIRAAIEKGGLTR